MHVTCKLVVVLLGIVTCAALLAIGCTPAYKGDVENALATPAGHQHVAAPAALEPQPGRVGQWALYRTSKADEVGYVKFSITQDACGIWFELVSASYTQRLASKVCYRSMPDMTTPDAWFDLAQVEVTQSNDNKPIVIDLRNEQNQQMRSSMRLKMQTSMKLFGIAQWRNNTKLPREDVDVPAGHFAQAARVTIATMVGAQSHIVTLWAHPSVPITGLIRYSTSAGLDTVLIGYGQEGAVSWLRNTPKQ